MRQFFKFMFAALLGTFLAGLVLLFLFIGSLAALGSAFSLEGKPTAVKDRSILRLSLDRPLQDRAPQDQLDLDIGMFKMSSNAGLDQILDNLDKAKHDDRIKGVFLDLGILQVGLPSIKEIRDKLIEFKQESGKPVVAYADVYSQKSYYLASAADHVYLVPEGTLDFRGLQSEGMFFAGMFEKLGIDIQFIRGTNNQFKSFGEAYTRKDMSPANKEQVSILINDLWDQLVTEVGSGRSMSTDRLNAIAEGMLVRKAEDAVTQGMVDSLLYRDQVLDRLKALMGLDADKDIEFIGTTRYAKAHVSRGSELTPSWQLPKIAVVYAQGEIRDGQGSDQLVGSATTSAAIREARKDTTVKAIVLRVNSPGGSGLASEVIWREVILAKREKPVVVSMGDVAASGGYYISCAADKIFAEPNTITGSIGVFGLIPNMQGFFNNKLGITFDGVKTHKYADMMTVTRPLSKEEKQIIQGFIDDFYDNFTKRVAEGRGMAVSAVDSIGQGRVWTGADALAIGLVDELGGLEAATADAALRVGLEAGDYSVVGYPKRKPMIEELREQLGLQAKSWMAEQALGEDAQMLRIFKQAQQATQRSGIQARMPFELEIY